jgi:hypothetical protein
MKRKPVLARAAALVLLAGFATLSPEASAHCDSLDGPVVQDARLALAKGDVTPVLKWVGAQHEAAIRDAFKATLAVRSQGDEAKTLADRYFFETLVRIHRAGEGEAFTGLKPATQVEPGIDAADEALAAGSANELEAQLAAAVTDGVRDRFALTVERAKHAQESVEAGRAYVEAYVDYIHFVENVHRLVSEGASHKHHEAAP